MLLKYTHGQVIQPHGLSSAVAATLCTFSAPKEGFFLRLRALQPQ